MLRRRGHSETQPWDCSDGGGSWYNVEPAERPGPPWSADPQPPAPPDGAAPPDGEDAGGGHGLVHAVHAVHASGQLGEERSQVTTTQVCTDLYVALMMKSAFATILSPALSHLVLVEGHPIDGSLHDVLGCEPSKRHRLSSLLGARLILRSLVGWWPTDLRSIEQAVQEALSSMAVPQA